jgi:hypothetical protein
MGVGQFIAEKHKRGLWRWTDERPRKRALERKAASDRGAQRILDHQSVSFHLPRSFHVLPPNGSRGVGVTYLHYGAGLIEALVIAKVVLIGKAVGLDRLGERRGPLIVPVVLKSGVFALLAILFAVLEHIVEGLIHKKDWASIASNLFGIGSLELFARMIMLFVSFIPFFAFWEIGQVLGRAELIEMFFSRRKQLRPKDEKSVMAPKAPNL